MAYEDIRAAGQAPECQTCPICTGLAALREARPEAVEHLLKAGAELLLAARALLDVTAEPAIRELVSQQAAREADLFVESRQRRPLCLGMATRIQLVRHEIAGPNTAMSLDAIANGVHGLLLCE